MLASRGIGLAEVTSNADCELFESLVDELLKDKPDARKIKTLCGKLGIHYIKNHADQIDDIIRNGSKVYLKSRTLAPSQKTNDAKSL